MRNLIIVVLFMFGAVFNASAQGVPAGNDPSWQRVGKLDPREKIKIHLRDGSTFKGKVVQVDENGLLLRINGDRSMQIAKGDVGRISRNSGARGALIGLGIGAGIGALIGGAAPRNDEITRAGNAALGAGAGGLIGVIGGGVIGKGQTIYQSRK